MEDVYEGEEMLVRGLNHGYGAFMGVWWALVGVGISYDLGKQWLTRGLFVFFFHLKCLYRQVKPF